MRWRIGWVLFMAAFGWYAFGAYPAVSAGDSGEFITAAHTLGIPHAPGYPAYVLLGKCADVLLPFGNIGYRLNLFSAFCGALAVVLLFGLALSLSVSMELSVFAALLFMVTRALSVNAQASEVFALHAVLCLAVLWTALENRWLLTAFLIGWGLGNHQTLLFLLPAIGVAYFARHPADRASPAALGLALFAGLSVYAFLYVRAARSPVVNMGDPESLERFWRVISRADYGSMTLALGDTPARTPESTLLQIGRFLQGLADQITWLGLAGGILGATLWVKRQVVPALTIGVAFTFLGPAFFLLGNLPFDAQANGVLERFYIVPAACCILFLTVGIQIGAKRLPRLAWAAFALPVFLVVEGGHAGAFRGDLRAYIYGRNNLRTLPPRAHFIMDGGDDTFYTLSYLTRVERRRRDVALHDRGGVVFPGFYGADFRSLARTEKNERRYQVERALVASGAPLYYSTMNEYVLPGEKMIQAGMLYTPASPFPTGEERQYWEIYDLRGVAPWMSPSHVASTDYRTRALVPFYAYQRSVPAGRDGAWDQAVGFASAAQAMGPDVIWLIPNLVHNAYAWAQTQFEAGRLEQAEALYQRITFWDPRAAAAWSNLGAIEEKQQRLEDAIAHYQKAIELDPSSESAHYNLAVAYWKQSNWTKVVEEFTRVLSLNPANRAARQYLDQAQARTAAPPS